jgi:tetratricopeptide (TPR) repeat protein
MTDEHDRGTRPPDGAERDRRSARPTRSGDAVSATLKIAIGVVVAAVVAGIAIAGVALYFKPTGPRTMVERQIAVTEQAVRLTPANPPAWRDLVSAYIASGDYAGARDAIARGKRALGDPSDMIAQEARVALLQGRSDEALRLADEAIKAAEKARDAKANELHEKAVIPAVGQLSSPAALTAQLVRADVFLLRRQWDAAATAYTKALEEDPQMADVLTLRGEAYLEAGEFALAKADFQAALRFVPDYAPALDGLAQAQEGASK